MPIQAMEMTCVLLCNKSLGERIKNVNANVLQPRKLAGFHRTITEGWENLKELMAFLLIFSVLELKQNSSCA